MANCCQHSPEAERKPRGRNSRNRFIRMHKPPASSNLTLQISYFEWSRKRPCLIFVRMLIPLTEALYAPRQVPQTASLRVCPSNAATRACCRAAGARRMESSTSSGFLRAWHSARSIRTGRQPEKKEGRKFWLRIMSEEIELATLHGAACLFEGNSHKCRGEGSSFYNGQLQSHTAGLEKWA